MTAINPRWLEIEEYLVTGLMLCTDEVRRNRVMNLVDGDWFVSRECRLLFLYLKSATEEEINPNSMDAALGDSDAWKAQRFREWLYRLMHEYPSGRLGGSIVENARLLAEAYKSRIFVEAASSAATSAQQEPHADYISPIEATIEKLKAINVDYRDGGTFGEQVLDYVDSVETGTAEAYGLSTGIGALDSKMGRLQPGQLIVIGARPSVGKSALAQSIALHNAARGKPVYFATMEMSAKEVIGRFVANEAGKPIQDVDEHVRAAAIEVSNYPLTVDDRPSLTTSQIHVAASDVENLSLVVIDYLQLLTPTNPTDIREQQVSLMARSCKLMAKELGVPVLLLSQLNRKATEGTPQLSHLRESGAVEQDANIVLLLDREIDDPLNRAMDIYIRKNRDGPVGLVEARFDPAIAKVTDVPITEHENYNPEFA